MGGYGQNGRMCGPVWGCWMLGQSSSASAPKLDYEAMVARARHWSDKNVRYCLFELNAETVEAEFGDLSALVLASYETQKPGAEMRAKLRRALGHILACLWQAEYFGASSAYVTGRSVLELEGVSVRAHRRILESLKAAKVIDTRSGVMCKEGAVWLPMMRRVDESLRRRISALEPSQLVLWVRARAKVNRTVQSKHERRRKERGERHWSLANIYSANDIDTGGNDKRTFQRRAQAVGEWCGLVMRHDVALSPEVAGRWVSRPGGENQVPQEVASVVEAQLVSEMPVKLNLVIVANARAVFEQQVSDGGRIHHGLSNVPSWARRGILIDGDQTVEVDASRLHPRMLFALRGEVMAHDPYDLGEELPQDQAKAVVNAAINAWDYEQLLWVIAQEGLGVADLDRVRAQCEYLAREHVLPALGLTREELSPELGRRNRTLESRALATTLRRLGKRDILVIPYHDGVRCREDDAEVVKTVFQRELGRACRVPSERVEAFFPFKIE